MLLEGLHEKELFSDQKPFRIVINDCTDMMYPPHWHNATEIIYVMGDRCNITVNTSNTRLNDREILWIPGGDIHSYFTKNFNGKAFFIQFESSILMLNSLFNDAMPYLNYFRRISYSNDSILHSSVEEQLCSIISEYEKQNPAWELKVTARLFDIFAILYGALLHESFYSTSVPTGKRIHGLQKLDKAFQYIRENYKKDISLKEIATATNFSAYHFSRIFKSITEKSFTQYLNEYRIREAEKLLMTSDTIAEVAYSVGFNSISTFNRAFKAVKGCTPTIYKNLAITHNYIV